MQKHLSVRKLKIFCVLKRSLEWQTLSLKDVLKHMELKLESILQWNQTYTCVHMKWSCHCIGSNEKWPRVQDSCSYQLVNPCIYTQAKQYTGAGWAMHVMRSLYPLVSGAQDRWGSTWFKTIHGVGAPAFTWRRVWGCNIWFRVIYAWCMHGVRMVYAWWCWQASLKRSIQARAMYSGSAPMGMDNLRRSVWFSTIYTSCKHANVCMGQFEGYKWCTKNKLRSSMRSRDICGVSMPMCTGPFELDLCMIQLGLCTCGVSILMWSEGLTWFRAIHSCCKHADVYKTVRKAPYHSRIYTCKWCKHASVFE